MISRSLHRTAPPIGCLALLGWAVVLRAESGGWTLDWTAGATLAFVTALSAAIAFQGRSEPAMARLLLIAAWLSTMAAWAIAAHPHAPLAPLADPVRAGAVGLAPAVIVHLMLAAPDGRLRSRRRGAIAAATYVLTAVAVVGADRPAWAGLSAVLMSVGLVGYATRLRRATWREQNVMLLPVIAAIAGVLLAVVAVVVWLVLDWAPASGAVAAAAALGLAPSLAIGSARIEPRLAERALHGLAGLVALVTVVLTGELLVVFCLGHAPARGQREVLALSILSATGAAAALGPLRTYVSHRFHALAYGRRPPPEHLVRAFETQLTRAIPLTEALLSMTEALRESLRLHAAEVWTGSNTFERVVSDPPRDRTQVTVSPATQHALLEAGVGGTPWLASRIPALGEGRDGTVVQAWPIAHAGELIGLIVIERAAESDPFASDELDLLSELARRVALVLTNERLDLALERSLDELRASRARVVAAADLERQRVERDLHDGIQQQLLALGMRLAAAREPAAEASFELRDLLQTVEAELRRAMRDLRRLTHGIYPPLLADAGLRAAVPAIAREASLPVRAHVGPITRYAPAIEATVYFCCLEALQNAAKHAGRGSAATLRVADEAGVLAFEVVDDGCGFDLSAHRPGVGLINMGDRLGAVGGTLIVDAAPGQGTRVTGTIPLSGVPVAQNSSGTSGPPSPVDEPPAPTSIRA